MKFVTWLDFHDLRPISPMMCRESLISLVALDGETLQFRRHKSRLLSTLYNFWMVNLVFRCQRGVWVSLPNLFW